MNHKENCFMLWIGDKLPELQLLSLKSMMLTGHKVKLFLYDPIPEAQAIADEYPDLEIIDAATVIPKEDIWRYKVSKYANGSVSGFANQWRYKYIHENGGTWIDFDIIAIRNITEFTKESDVLIGSEKMKVKDGFRVKPNNGLMSFPAGDPLNKMMLDTANKLGDNAKHAEAGPRLLVKLLKKKDWALYTKFVVSEWFMTPVAFHLAKSYAKDTMEDFWKDHNVDTSEIFGFHVWNSYFTTGLKKNLLVENVKEGSIYDVLRNAVNECSTPEEYYERLKVIIPGYQC